MAANINGTWSSIAATLDAAGAEDEDDVFLRYHWWIWPKASNPDGAALSKTTDIHDAIKSVLPLARAAEATADFLNDYLADTRPAVSAFADIRNPSSSRSFAFAGPDAASIAEHALALKRLRRSAVVTPLLMSATLRFGRDPIALSEVFRLSEVFLFRLSLLERRANTGESSLMRLALDLRKSEMSSDAVLARMRELIVYYAADRDVERALLEPDGSSPDGDFYAWPQIAFLLFEYERELVMAAKQKFAYDWDAFFARWRESIEHILPQGETTLTVPYWRDRFTEEAWRRNRHRLGNLTLTEWNPSYGNRGFDEKCGARSDAPTSKSYRNSRFHSERELCGELEWNERAIDERQRRIAAFAMRRWRIE